MPRPDLPSSPQPDLRLLIGVRSRALVEQATGVLMEIRGCPAEEALALLRGTGRAQHRPLEDVAAELISVAGPVRG